eukprot:162369-Pelagomonas_calceolata.AAC.11
MIVLTTLAARVMPSKVAAAANEPALQQGGVPNADACTEVPSGMLDGGRLLPANIAPVQERNTA